VPPVANEMMIQRTAQISADSALMPRLLRTARP
jgi:hypothetical protein